MSLSSSYKALDSCYKTFKTIHEIFNRLYREFIMFMNIHKSPKLFNHLICVWIFMNNSNCLISWFYFDYFYWNFVVQLEVFVRISYYASNLYSVCFNSFFSVITLSMHEHVKVFRLFWKRRSSRNIEFM